MPLPLGNPFASGNKGFGFDIYGDPIDPGSPPAGSVQGDLGWATPDPSNWFVQDPNTSEPYQGIDWVQLIKDMLDQSIAATVANQQKAAATPQIEQKTVDPTSQESKDVNDANMPAQEPGMPGSTVEGPPNSAATDSGGLGSKITNVLSGIGGTIGNITNAVNPFIQLGQKIAGLFQTSPEGWDKIQATKQQEQTKATILAAENGVKNGTMSPRVAEQQIQNAVKAYATANKWDMAGLNVVQQIASQAMANIQTSSNYLRTAPPGESNNPVYRNMTLGESQDRAAEMGLQMLQGTNIGKDFAKASPLGTLVQPIGEKMKGWITGGQDFVNSMAPNLDKYQTQANDLNAEFKKKRADLMANQNYGV